MEANQGAVAWSAMRHGNHHREGTFSPKGPMGACLGAQEIHSQKNIRDPIGIYGGVLRGVFRRDTGEIPLAEQEGAKEGLRQQ